MYHFIKDIAKEEGFSLCGITPALKVDGYDAIYGKWIARREHAGMEWIERNTTVRQNPDQLVEGARTIVVCAMNYAIRNIPQHPDAKIAAYALAEDYHVTLKKALRRMLQQVIDRSDIPVTGRVFVDSAPLTERYWAQQAGLGWIGKSGMLINREVGSYTLLGTIILDRAMDRYDLPDPFNGCGACEKCKLHCPTGAINEDKTINCNRCISYLTIEHKGAFPETTEKLLTEKNNGWIYGCDICIKVCPWNKRQLSEEAITKATPAQQTERSYAFTLASNDRVAWLRMAPETFRTTFGKTPLFRTGVEAIKRNINNKNE